jgi:hypothetical protein
VSTRSVQGGLGIAGGDQDRPRQMSGIVPAQDDQDLAGVAQSLSGEQNQVLAAEYSVAAGGDVWLGW